MVDGNSSNLRNIGGVAAAILLVGFVGYLAFNLRDGRKKQDKIDNEES